MMVRVASAVYDIFVFTAAGAGSSPPHIRHAGELERLFLHPELSGWVRVDELYFDTGNWCVRATKIKEHDASPL